ncbi:hypothetical protein BGZ52_009505 [Haplosporangium bisporale]|nr:hypothetical protein BGZ52_009505 [Haplosporangium bisporale]
MDSICVSHLYVGNLPWWATYQNLLEVFSVYGSIRRCNIARRNDNRPLYGFVTFRDQDSALHALCSPIYLGGRRLAIQVSNRQVPPRLTHPVGLPGTHSNTFDGYDDEDRPQSTRTKRFSQGSRYLSESRHSPSSLLPPGEDLESRPETPSPIVPRYYSGSRDRLSHSPATRDVYRGSDQDARGGYKHDRDSSDDDRDDRDDIDDRDVEDDDHDDSSEYSDESDDDRTDRCIGFPPTFTRYCSRSPLIEYGVRSNLPSNRGLQRFRSHSPGIRSSHQGRDIRPCSSGKGSYSRHRHLRHLRHHRRRSGSSDSGDYHKSHRSRARRNGHHRK